MNLNKTLIGILCGAATLLPAGSLCAVAADDGQGLWIGSSAADTVYYDTTDRNSRAGAEELAGYLERVLGRKFASKGAARGKLGAGAGIVIGAGLVPEELQRDLPPGDEEWFCRAVAGDKLYLWGNDKDERYRKFSGTRWAAQDFLERECGVRWLWPGRLGEVVPKKSRITVATGVREIERPVFRIREIKSGYPFASDDENKDIREWVLHMRQGRSLFGYQGSSGFGHATFIPQSEYGASHPEYYSLVSPRNWVTSPRPAQAQRTNNAVHLWQACTSNPEVRRIFAEKIIANNSPDIQSITPLDGYAFCECDKCKAQDPVPWKTYTPSPNLSDRIFDFAVDVAEQVKAKSPESKVGILAYSFYTSPPTRMLKFPDNLYICICYSSGEFRNPELKRNFERQIAGFRAMGARFSAYEYWGTHYYFNLPWLHTKEIDGNLKFFSRNGGDGIRGEGGKDWANNALNYYLLCKLLWNPERSREEIIDDFCCSAFGSGAEGMKAYFGYLESTVDEWFEKQLKEKKPTGGRYAIRMNSFVEIFTPEALGQAEKLLNEAKRRAVQAEEKERVDFFRTGLNYTKIMVKMIADYRQAAAYGANLMFVWPEPGIDIISDETIGKSLLAAEQSNRKRESFLCRAQGKCALDLGYIIYHNRTDKHSWDRIIQDNLWAWRKGEYNYLVNGAFEYCEGFESVDGTLEYRAGYGWKVTSNNDKNSHNYGSESNHDDITNQVAQYHANQGRSLKVSLEPRSTTIATSTVGVMTEPGKRWSLSGWLQQPSGTSKLEAAVVLKIDGRVQEVPLRLQEKREIIRDLQGWHEVQFMPFSVPEGKNIEMRVLLKLSNTGRSGAVMRLDDLKLKKAR